ECRIQCASLDQAAGAAQQQFDSAECSPAPRARLIDRDERAVPASQLQNQSPPDQPQTVPIPIIGNRWAADPSEGFPATCGTHRMSQAFHEFQDCARKTPVAVINQPRPTSTCR